MEFPLAATVQLDFAYWGAAGLEALAAANNTVIAHFGGHKEIVYGLDRIIGFLSRAAGTLLDLTPARPPPPSACWSTASSPPLLLLGGAFVGPPLWCDQRGDAVVAEVREGHWRCLSPRVAAKAAAQGGWAVLDSTLTAATPGILGVFALVHLSGTPRHVLPRASCVPLTHALVAIGGGSGPQYGPRWVPCLTDCLVQLLRELRCDSPMLLRQRSDLPLRQPQIMSAASARPPGRTCALVAAAPPQKVTLLRELPTVDLGAFGHLLQRALQRGMDVVVDTHFARSHPLARLVAGVSLAEHGNPLTWGVQETQLVPRDTGSGEWWQHGVFISALWGPVCITVHTALNVVVLTSGEPCQRSVMPQFEAPSWPPAPRSATAPPHGPALAQHLSTELGAVQQERDYLRWHFDRSTPEQALQRATAAGRASLGPGLGPYVFTGQVLGSGEGGKVYEVADPRGRTYALKALPLRGATDHCPAVSEVALTGITAGHPHIAGLVDLVCAADVEGVPTDDLCALLHAHPPLAGEPVAAYGHAAEIVSVSDGGAIARYATTGAQQFVPWSALIRYSAKATTLGIVMERYAGSLMAHGTLPAPDREQLLVQVACALRFLRAKGFSHCDVHPGNILMASEPDGGHRFVLADLGRCRPASPATIDLDCWALGICGGIASGVRTSGSST
eukprot:TRINITY_DN14248_c0_g1_i3.p1 TRINITY_DN14248_c0_g1~~TRINITY_DN14248_c0_g1_i3.p1  ORF type:complete len:708 (+),score=128.72 TRINITY_DN14248_c0_g1_i3:101-2125(+)